MFTTLLSLSTLSSPLMETALSWPWTLTIISPLRDLVLNWSVITSRLLCCHTLLLGTVLYRTILYFTLSYYFQCIGPLNLAIHGIRVASVIEFSVGFFVCFSVSLLHFSNPTAI